MRVFAFSILLLVLGFAGPTADTSAVSDVSRTVAGVDTTLAARIGQGAQVFSRTCQRCHDPRGPAERTDREWVMIMQHMRTRANLTGKQASLALEFLLASNQAAMAPGRVRPDLSATLDTVTVEIIEAGRAIYASAGTCFACHGAALEGGPIAPSLKDDTWKVGEGDYASILDVVRNGVPGTAMAAYPGGIDDEAARQVAAFVWAVAHKEVDP